MHYLYNHGVVGGTFDHFHAGHKQLIDTACRQSARVTIGLSTSPLFKDKLFSFSIEEYKTRENNLLQYIAVKGYQSHVTIVPIHDMYGNSLKEKTIDAIFVTQEGIINATEINEQRKKIHFNPLKIVTVPFLKGNDGEIIASKRIRSGEIDRNGYAYMKVFTKNKKFILPEVLREELRIPFGKVITEIKECKEIIQNNHFIIAVGDIVTSFLSQSGCQPTISIIDFKSKRETIADKNILQFLPKPQILLSNQPGTIDQKVVLAYQFAIKQFGTTNEKQTIGIIGEEDLLALPAILLAPLQSILFYGLYDVGAVAVTITEKKKRQIKQLLEKFNG